MNDVGFLYHRDKDTGEYKILGKIEEIDKISADEVDVVDERRMRAFDPNKTMTFTFKPPRIIDTTAREIEEVEEDEEN